MLLSKLTIYHYSIYNFCFYIHIRKLDFQLSAVSSNVLIANWTKLPSSNGTVIGYKVYCVLSQNQTYPEQMPFGVSTYAVFNVTNQTSVYLSGLLPFTFYQCYVTANTIAGEGIPSIISTYQTSQTGTCISTVLLFF